MSNNDMAMVSLFEDCKKIAERLNLTIEFGSTGISVVVFVEGDESRPFFNVVALWSYLQGYAKAKGVK